MAGNELKVIDFLIRGLGSLKLNHLDTVKSIGAPIPTGGFKPVNSLSESSEFSTEDSGKKADVYINGRGVSFKQAGGSFSFNRLQRAELIELFNLLRFSDSQQLVERIDKEVDDFHNGLIKDRRRPWAHFFSETEFKRLVRFLMTEGSPNKGYSSHMAELILVAPKSGISERNINVHTFDEYFELHKNDLFFSIRRQWIGQSSDTEHKRASGLAKKEGNQKWVYQSISGQPKPNRQTKLRWREDVSPADRRTVYMIFIEKQA
jgi:hypothetical protein